MERQNVSFPQPNQDPECEVHHDLMGDGHCSCLPRGHVFGADNTQAARDNYFLGMAQHVASRSKDPSTQTGAVIVDPRGRVVSTGYNGFPQKMPDLPELYANREEKYSRIVHCEMNALIFAESDLTGCTLYTYPFISCDRCCVHMLQAGIVRFVAPKCPPDQATRWESVLVKSRRYIVECGATVEEL